MKLTAKIKLLPSKRQAEKLLATIQEANKAANRLSDLAWEKKVFKQFDLHKAQYYGLKESFTLSSQMLVRIIGKVADAYKLDKKTKRTFRPTGAIAYDTRILTYDLPKKRVSIWTVDGRMKIEYVGGKHNEALLQYQKGESDLLYTGGKFFLLATCDIPDNDTHVPEDVLGVDLGIVNIASDSDGQTFSGAKVESTRQWYLKRRGVLQSVGTKSAKCRLKKLSGKQAKFQKDSNHSISKQLVTKAKATRRGIVLEDLQGISKNVRREEKRGAARRLRKSQRSKHSNWSFNQLRQYITYKAQIQGVVVTLINPRNTSRTCSVCGHCEKGNRKSQSEFLCLSCNFHANADWNASQNIRTLGLVNRPMVSELLFHGQAPCL